MSTADDMKRKAEEMKNRAKDKKDDMTDNDSSSDNSLL